MNNAGVLTFINTINYGAELQALALVRTLNRFKCETDLINYNSSSICAKETPKFPSLSEIIHPGDFAFRLYKYLILERRAKTFRSYTEKNINLGSSVRNAQDILSKYQNIVVGSDQVWCPKITDNDETFLVPGNRLSGQKVISYAASFGDSSLPADLRQEFSENLSRFDALSVREKSGLNTLAELGLCNGVVSLDPTLLLTASEWTKYAERARRPDRYVFVYTVSESKKTIAFAKHAAKELGAKLLYIKCYGGSPIIGAKNLSASSPGEFLDLIMHAELVVTSSFHGLCFSILFNRPFRYVLSADKDKSRLYNLVSELGLEWYGVENGDLSDHVDFTEANRRLLVMRKESLAYLRDSLA